MIVVIFTFYFTYLIYRRTFYFTVVIIPPYSFINPELFIFVSKEERGFMKDDGETRIKRTKFYLPLLM